MEPSFIRFVWRHSRREQIGILLLTVLSFPLVYISLEIPKIIVNEAISGSDFPRDLLGLSLEQVPYLLFLCAAFLSMVVAINAIKWFMNVSVGMTGERMLRRLRFTLLQQVMRFRMKRFRTVKPGEVIQSLLGEIEPLGGFIGEVIATPAFQGGLLVVYCTFIFMQDVFLGLAAISLYPLQAFLIPKLQKKVIRLNKKRAGNTRRLADTISESVGQIADIHTNDTARWHMAQVSGRLHTNTLIRMDIFKRKFTIKFINNFLNQLTPFFFYSIGGYLVIQGRLDFGSLVAVLAAYKDLAAPWRALLTYVQNYSDLSSRYRFVIEHFEGADLFEMDRIYPGPDAKPLSGPLQIESLEGGAGTGGLTIPRFTLQPRTSAAVTGGDSGAREALLRFAAGLGEPERGRIALGNQALGEASLPQLGAAVAFLGTEPGIVNRSIRDNMLYGLYRDAPAFALADHPEAKDLALAVAEAKRTGNILADPEGDWIDYAAAGVDGAEALEDRLLHLVEVTGLAQDLRVSALSMRVPANEAEQWTDAILAARQALAETGADLGDVLEFWTEDRLNTNSALLTNALYAMPVTDEIDLGAMAALPAVRSVLEESKADLLFAEIGWEIAAEFAQVVAAVDANSPVLDGFPGYSRGEIVAAAEVADQAPRSRDGAPPEEAIELSIGLAARYVQTRDRLDVLTDDRVRRLLQARKLAMRQIAGRDDFVRFDENRFSPARTIAANILGANRRFDRRTAWPMLDERVRAAVQDAGITDALVRLGLTAVAGSRGAALTAVTKRRIALVRALLKRPKLIVLDGPGASAGAEDRAILPLLRAELPEAIILFAAQDREIAAHADREIRLGADGALIGE
ncbi:MAG: ABC transporter transmembrane domain-containing protein [Pseudomonadota bacterium]